MVRLLAVVAAGSALGVIGRLSDGWSHQPRVLFALGSPWVVLAVLVGVLAPGRRRAPVLAAAALLVSVGVYYVVMAAVEQRVGPVYATAMIAGWGGLAVIVGAIFGAAGSALRGSPPLPAAGPPAAPASRAAPASPAALRSAAAAFVGGTLAGEAVLFLARGNSAVALLLAQLAVGLAVAIGLARPARRTQLLALTAVFAGVTFVIDAGARLVMARYGWGGG
jgi:hypothetical protein